MLRTRHRPPRTRSRKCGSSNHSSCGRSSNDIPSTCNSSSGRFRSACSESRYVIHWPGYRKNQRRPSRSRGRLSHARLVIDETGMIEVSQHSRARRRLYRELIGADPHLRPCQCLRDMSSETVQAITLDADPCDGGTDLFCRERPELSFFLCLASTTDASTRRAMLALSSSRFAITEIPSPPLAGRIVSLTLLPKQLPIRIAQRNRLEFHSQLNPFAHNLERDLVVLVIDGRAGIRARCRRSSPAR